MGRKVVGLVIAFLLCAGLMSARGMSATVTHKKAAAHRVASRSRLTTHRATSTNRAIAADAIHKHAAGARVKI